MPEQLPPATAPATPAADPRAEADSLLRWYEADARPFLLAAQPEAVPPLDADARNVEAALAADPELAVCFLGTPGVGTTTLVNALVAGAGAILPAGGVGSRTAVPVTVRHASGRRFEAAYHPPARLGRLARALEAALGSASPHARPAGGDDDLGLGDRAGAEGAAAADADGPQLTQPLAELRRQARLLVTGDPDGPAGLDYLADSLREATGSGRRWGTAARPEDEARVLEIRTALASASDTEGVRTCTADEPGFADSLARHASGSLAPLVKELRVFWDAPLLAEGLTLVDLPGVWAAADAGGGTAGRRARGRAGAVVLAVDPRGLTETHAGLLRGCGFPTCLPGEADDPVADPVALVVAVVNCDSAAEDGYARDRSRTRAEHLEAVRREAADRVRRQLGSMLEGARASDAAAGPQTRGDATGAAPAGFQVHAVSAAQYRKVLAADGGDPAFVADAARSGVPGLAGGLAALAREWREGQAARVRAAAGDLARRGLAAVRVSQAQWREVPQSANGAEGFRRELEQFVDPLRREFDAARGAFREFLEESVPTQIRGLAEGTPGNVSSRMPERLLAPESSDLPNVPPTGFDSLEKWNANTLAATARSGGYAPDDNYFNLSQDIVLAIEKAIKGAWVDPILQDIRSRTRRYARERIASVDRLIAWAEGRGVRSEGARAQGEVARADAERLEAVGGGLADEPLEELRASLYEMVCGPVRDACEIFTFEGEDRGEGSKCRIIALFRRLAEDAAGGASGLAADFLTARLREVGAAIGAVLAAHPDPLAAAAEAVVASREARLNPSDPLYGPRILAQAKAVLTACPAAASLEAGADAASGGEPTRPPRGTKVPRAARGSTRR
jgi:hypothetical protein